MKKANGKIRCLVTDHDDTAVNSTPEIHYPAYRAALSKIRPKATPVGLKEYFKYNFDPGFMNFMKGIYGMSDVEIEEEVAIWRTFTERMVPTFFSGFLDVLRDFTSLGGIVAVVSHSEAEFIRRDYRAAGDFQPSAIHGWDMDPEKRKPHPAPLLSIMREFSLSPNELLVLDDLKPGLLMARAAGVKFAGAGWSFDIPEIRAYLSANGDYYFDSIGELRKFLFE